MRMMKDYGMYNATARLKALWEFKPENADDSPQKMAGDMGEAIIRASYGGSWHCVNVSVGKFVLGMNNFDVKCRNNSGDSLIFGIWIRG